MSEVWVALERLNDNGDESIVFHVLDEDTGEVRAERRLVSELQVCNIPAELPWRFRKYNDFQIYQPDSAIGWLCEENGNGKEKA